MVVSPRLPGLPRTLQKHQYVGSGSKRPRMEECLLLDVLEAIMAFLDRETLCTARLVSKTLCTAASAHVCSLIIPSTCKAVPFHRYPHLRHVSVMHDIPSARDEEEESFALLDPCLRDVATTFTVGGSAWPTITQTRGYLSQVALMPKLRGLFVDGTMEHGAALLARCTNLEAIRCSRCSSSTVRAISSLTRLTYVDISNGDEAWSDDDEDPLQDEDQDNIHWLEPLKNLQALRILPFYETLPLIGNHTGLTGLTLWHDMDESPTYSIAPLTRLTRLRSLCIEWDMTEDNLCIACSLGLGSLVDLEVWVSYGASADCGRFLSRQTALTRLTLRGAPLCKLQHIGGVRIELLQCLELQDRGVLDAEDLSVLGRATSITELSICPCSKQTGLSQVLAGLTQLRSLTGLSWYRRENDARNIQDLSLALSPLTALTKLHLYSHRLDDGDLGAVLVLKGLRVLELRYCRVTDDVLPELAALTSLSSLTIEGNGVTSLASVSEALDPLRHARGLPPLQTSTSMSQFVQRPMPQLTSSQTS